MCSHEASQSLQTETTSDLNFSWKATGMLSRKAKLCVSCCKEVEEAPGMSAYPLRQSRKPVYTLQFGLQENVEAVTA